MAEGNLEHHVVQSNGLQFHVVQAGPLDGPVAILLHGFPEFWIGWRTQIDALVSAGFRVWIPDQRGYGGTEKPIGVRAYAMDQLVEDVRGLIAKTGRQQVFLLGHDWGGAVAWQFANRHPDMVRRLVIANAAHFQVMRNHLRSKRSQRLRSWYIFLFQIPRLPEFLLRLRDYDGLKRMLRSASRPGTFSDHELMEYREAWERPGALSAMVNWYRAAFRDRKRPFLNPRIVVPTLLIWGAKDIALRRELAQPSIEMCDDGKLVFLEEAGHWVLHEEPAQVSALILGFLR